MFVWQIPDSLEARGPRNVPGENCKPTPKLWVWEVWICPWKALMGGGDAKRGGSHEQISTCSAIPGVRTRECGPEWEDVQGLDPAKHALAFTWVCSAGWHHPNGSWHQILCEIPDWTMDACKEKEQEKRAWIRDEQRKCNSLEVCSAGKGRNKETFSQHFNQPWHEAQVTCVRQLPLIWSSELAQYLTPVQKSISREGIHNFSLGRLETPRCLGSCRVTAAPVWDQLLPVQNLSAQSWDFLGALSTWTFQS